MRALLFGRSICLVSRCSILSSDLLLTFARGHVVLKIVHDGISTSI
jgi:hypothetical protein